jgi:P pilus assembly chaperone PapD
MNIFKFLHVVCIAAFILLFSMPALTDERAVNTSNFSLEDLLITPKRIVFEGKTRSSEVILLNRSDKTLTYKLLFVNYHMKENGKLENIDTPGVGDRIAEKYLRFTPRRVILEPQQTQMVRMQLMKPDTLSAGEYRSHLLFQVVPSATEAAAQTEKKQERGIQIKLIPIYGISIPVIVRQGSLKASVLLNDPHIVSEAGGKVKAISLIMERSGDRSVYGDMTVTWKRSGSKDITVGEIKGVAIYTPNAKREVLVALSPPKDVSFHGGQLTVRFAEPEDGSQPLTAESTIPLP